MAAALLRSIEANSDHPEVYRIYILADKLSQINQERLLKASSLDVEFVHITSELLSTIELPKKVDYLPKTAYFRLMIPELFSAFKKIIYLDVDTLVLNNLEELWKIDMEDSLCLACQCFYAENHRGQQNFRKLGINEYAPYFNSGVLVIDVAKWRNFRVREKVNDLLNHKLNDPKAMDEEALNVVLHGHWKPIDQEWNYPPHIVDEKNPPNIVHYIGFKPMYYDYKTGAQELFFSYLKGTYWEKNRQFGFIKKARIKAPFIIRTYLNRLLSKRLLQN